MGIAIKEVGPEALQKYGWIPMRFRVKSILRVEEIDGGLAGLSVTLDGDRRQGEVCESTATALREAPGRVSAVA